MSVQVCACTCVRRRCSVSAGCRGVRRREEVRVGRRRGGGVDRREAVRRDGRQRPPAQLGRRAVTAWRAKRGAVRRQRHRRREHAACAGPDGRDVGRVGARVRARQALRRRRRAVRADGREVGERGRAELVRVVHGAAAAAGVTLTLAVAVVGVHRGPVGRAAVRGRGVGDEAAGRVRGRDGREEGAGRRAVVELGALLRERLPGPVAHGVEPAPRPAGDLDDLEAARHLLDLDRPRVVVRAALLPGRRVDELVEEVRRVLDRDRRREEEVAAVAVLRRERERGERQLPSLGRRGRRGPSERGRTKRSQYSLETRKKRSSD